MSSHTFATALIERREQLGLTSLQDTANYLDDHRTKGEEGVTSRYSIRDWSTGRYSPALAMRPVIARALCIPLETVHMLCSGMMCEIPRMPADDELLGGDHAE